jgi:hypothetical protein
VLFGISGAPIAAGCPALATSHSRSVPSAAATASTLWSGLRLTDCSGLPLLERVSGQADGDEHQRRERRHQAVQPPGTTAFCLLAGVLLGD